MVAHFKKLIMTLCHTSNLQRLYTSFLLLHLTCRIWLSRASDPRRISAHSTEETPSFGGPCDLSWLSDLASSPTGVNPILLLPEPKFPSIDPAFHPLTFGLFPNNPL